MIRDHGSSPRRSRCSCDGAAHPLCPRQRRRRCCAAPFGRLSRVKTPFLLPSTRQVPCAVAKSAKFQICSPTTASMRSKTRCDISSSAVWYSSVHGAEVALCSPATGVGAVFGHDDRLAVLLRPRAQLGLEIALGAGEVAGVGVPAVVPVEHEDVEQVRADVLVDRSEHHVDEADRARRVQPPRLGRERLEVGARRRRLGLGLVGDAPQHDARVVLVARDQLLDRLAVDLPRGGVDRVLGERDVALRRRRRRRPGPCSGPRRAVSSITTMPRRSA